MFAMQLRAALLFAGLLPVSAINADAVDSKSTPGKAMNMDQPMPIKMAKPGMKKAEVKIVAENKEREMKPMMDREAAGAVKK